MKLFNSLQITDEANHLKTLISDQMNRTVESASSWLTPVLIAEHGFALHKKFEIQNSHLFPPLVVLIYNTSFLSMSWFFMKTNPTEVNVKYVSFT